MKNLSIKCSLVFFLLLSNAMALTLKESVEKTISANPEIAAKLENQNAFKKYVDQEEGDYLPTVDLESYYESAHTYNSPDSSAKSNTHRNGWNTQLNIEQILYDGGLSSSEVKEAISKRDSNQFKTNFAVENIILDTTKTYLDLVQYKELMKISMKMIKIQDKNLITAKQKEEISGEKLETYEVSSKLHFTTEQFLEQEDLNSQTKYDFKKYVGEMPQGEVCRPLINEKRIPHSLEEIVKLVVVNHYSIREQVENIKIKREKIVQSDASFLPTLLFQLQGEWDDDLTLAENGKQDEYRARFFMKWNLFEGGKNKTQSQQETLFLQESKKTLDAITNDIVNQVTNEYNSYYKLKQRVDVLKKYVHDNKNILNVYRKEFDAGTRTFIDILNAEAEVYRSNTTLIKREFDLYKNYYSLLLNLSVLSDSILLPENKVCLKTSSTDFLDDEKNKKIKNIDQEIEELFEENVLKTDSITNQKEALTVLELKNLNTNNVISESSGDEFNTKQENDEKNGVEGSLQNFLDSSLSSYTLNIVTLRNIQEAKDFIKKYNLSDKEYHFKFGKNMDNVKILYGVYETYDSAKEALAVLDFDLMKKSSPYIDNIKKHKNLYFKYN